MTTLAVLLAAALASGAAAEKPSASPRELSRFSTPAFSVLLPASFHNDSKDPLKLEDTNGGRNGWLWGVAAAQPGRFSLEELEKFAEGGSCPRAQGQAVHHPKRVRTKALLGARFSCGTPDGRPYGNNARVSGWMRVQANSPRFDRRYTLHLNFWGDPRSPELQKLLDKIVLSFQEKGGPSTLGGAKRLQSTGF